MVTTIQGCSEDALREWKEMASKCGGSTVIDVFPYLEMFTSSVLAQLMFSSTYTPQIKETFFQLLELESLGKLATDIFNLPGEKYFPTKRNRRAKQIDQFARVSFTSMINERLEKRKDGTHNGESNDLLDIFMEELKDAKTTKDRQKIIEDIIGQCKIFFFAGFGTSSNLLCWAMVKLSLYKDWQVRAREEVLQVMGDRNQITSNDLSQMKIVTMIFNEILRLYPSGMEFSRILEEDTTLGDYTIPKDTLITCPILLLNWSTELWGEDAKTFNPGRFSDGIAKATQGQTPYMPFGWGPRICIAQNFVSLEIKTFLAMLFRNFSFELSENYKHAPYVDFTIRPQYGAPLVLTKL